MIKTFPSNTNYTIDPTRQTIIMFFIVATLMYLTIRTRPDIPYSVCQFAQRNQIPHMEQEKPFEHLLRYLRTTKQLRLQYTKNNRTLKDSLSRR